MYRDGLVDGVLMGFKELRVRRYIEMVAQTDWTALRH